MAERKALAEIVDDMNLTMEGVSRTRIDLLRRETDSNPGFDTRAPQGLIDRALRMEDCDIFIEIFWTRFGSSVYDGASGTEHEFRRAYEAWKQRGAPPILTSMKSRTVQPHRKNWNSGRVS